MAPKAPASANASTSQARLNTITAYLEQTSSTIQILSESFKTPFLQAILGTAQSLTRISQTIKQNRGDCALLLEQTNTVLCAIVGLHVGPDAAGGGLTPNVLDHIGDFTTTLLKIHSFVEGQQEGSKIRVLLRFTQMNALFNECKEGLQRAFEVFRIQANTVLENVEDMQQNESDQHQRVLNLIEGMSIYSGSDASSLMSRPYSASFTSSTSFSLLPSMPKIFHGRDSELSAIIDLFTQTTTTHPRIAILGAGGMGKTCLARAVLHHHELSDRYADRRYFIACESALTRAQLVALIGDYVGLKPGRGLERDLLAFFKKGQPGVLVLDNLETAWEQADAQKEIEQLLALLSECNHLALIITMRGAERPVGVRWTRPFLPTLQPLSYEAAEQIFLDIADEDQDPDEIRKLIGLTDNMPLVVDLIAHLVDAEGSCAAVLSRWESHKTALISEGYSKHSNLDMSISLSISSTRLSTLPHALDLLSILSILPDGLSESELAEINFPISDISHCRLALLRTSLSYTTAQRRTKVLVPIREYIQKHHPPRAEIVLPLLKSYQSLLDICQKHYGTLASSELVPLVTTSSANIQSVMRYRLLDESSDHSDTIYCAIYLNSCSSASGRGQLKWLEDIQKRLPSPTNHRLEVYLITEYLSAHQRLPNADELIQRGLDHIQYMDDPNIISEFYRGVKEEVATSISFFNKALVLANETANTLRQSQALIGLAWCYSLNLGDFVSGQRYAIQAQTAARLGSDLYQESLALNIEATCACELGDYSLGIANRQRARLLLARCGLVGGDLDQSITNSLAALYHTKSEYLEAHKMLSKLLDDVPKEDDPARYGFTLLNIVDTEIAMHAPVEEIRWKIDAGRKIFDELKWMKFFVYCDIFDARLALRAGDTPRGKKLLVDAVHAAAGKNSEAVAFALEILGNTEASGTTGRHWTTTFLAQTLKSKQQKGIHQALRFLGDIDFRNGDVKTAEALYSLALDGFTRMDIHQCRAECMVRLGQIAVERGDIQSARDWWAEARPLFIRSSQGDQVECLDEKLARLR
ncbi:hypothetical protein C8F01DRAFT_1130593 [Mycena amicta]|nr:hypothetical protein C8F01DRAFT_1130593 [Mycena amicta]